MPILLAFFLLCVACGEVGDNPPTENTTNDDTLMDFNIQLESINSDKPFSAFNKRLLMIYYIKPLCTYCQNGYGNIQQIANKYEPKGLASIAIVVGYANKSDILWFIEEYEASMPFFQDSEYMFSKKYGTGYTPMHYLVFPNRKILSYENSGSQIKKMVSDIEAYLSK